MQIFSTKTHDCEVNDSEAILDGKEHVSVEKEQVESLEKQEPEVPKSPCLETPGDAAVTVAASTSLRRRVSDETTTNIAVAYRQEMMAQLLLYSSSLFLVHLLFISGVAIVLSGKVPHQVHYGFAQFLFPLQGLFNILIYLRPAARITRIRRDSSWIKAYYLVIKNGGEAVKEEMQIEQMVKIKYPSSVKFGVANPPEKLCGVSNECMYVNSSEQLSRENAVFNSSKDWHHIVGSEGPSAQEPQDVIACIHHNDLEMIGEESDVDSQQLVSSEIVSRD